MAARPSTPADEPRGHDARGSDAHGDDTHAVATKVTPREARELTHEASLDRAEQVSRRARAREGDPDLPDATGGGMPRMLLILLGLAAGYVCIQAISSYKDLIAPVFLALNFIIAAYPLKAWLHRHRCPEWLASIVMGLVVFIAFIAFFWALGWAVASLVSELPNYTDKFESMYQSGLSELGKLGLSETKLESQLKGVDPQSVMSYATTVLTSLQSITGLLTVVVMMLFFLMMDATGWGSRMDVARRHHPRVVDALDAFGGGVRRYWLVSSFFGLIVAVLNWGALIWLGVPLAAVWAVLSFLTNYIPNVGFVIGLVPPALMGLLAKGPKTAILVIVAYCVLNFVVQSIIQPKFAGDAIGVTPTLSFLSLLFWANVMGPMGAILALPMTLLVKAVLVDADPRSRWFNAFVAADHATAESPTVMDAVDPDEEHEDATA